MAKPARFEIYRVYDEFDAFAPLPDLVTNLKAEVREEPVWRGLSQEIGTTHYARFAYGEGETRPSATARARATLAEVPIPAGTRFVLEEIDFVSSNSAAHHKGLRTYVIFGDPVLTTFDIVDAHAIRDAEPGRVGVSVELSQWAGQRFQRATSEWVHRRMAILIDDEVKTAPVVVAATVGYRFQLVLASGDDIEQNFAEAQSLARRLKPWN